MTSLGIDPADFLGDPGATASASTSSSSALTSTLTAMGARGAWGKWTAAIMQAAEREKVDAAVLGYLLAVSRPGGKVTASEIRNAAKALARAFYATGSVSGALGKLLGPAGPTSYPGGPGAPAGGSAPGTGAWEPPLPSGYIPNFNTPLVSTVPAVSTAGPKKPPAKKLTPEEQVALSIYKSQLKKSITDPWVAIVNGKVKLYQTLNPPKKVKGGISLGIRMSDFQSFSADYNKTYEAFIGRKARPGEVAALIRKGWSTYQIQNMLSKTKAFRNSPIWRASAPAYNGAARDLLGMDVWDSISSDQRHELLRKAILEDWGPTTFQEKLRARPEYLRSVEFRSTSANLSSVYESIYGIPGGASMTTIKEAALARWTPDQFGAWLRSQPGYTQSPEYLTKGLAVLDALGMITGTLPALRPGGGGASPYPSPGAGPPDSPRVPGAPGAPTGTGLALAST